MADRTSATPLLALDAVVLDTETTSLDPRVARIVEVGAVRLAAGRLQEDTAFRSLVNPGIPIPPVSTSVHGIDDAKVASAPDYASLWPRLSDFMDGAVLIGHSIGYDLAIMAREAERAKIPFSRPRTLDVRLLAQIVEPALAGYSLDNLAVWLGVDAKDRHSAYGDALTAARIFVALVPKLREGNIRTLAEAEAACGKLTTALEEQHRAGWVEPVLSPARLDAERVLARLDAYPYRHRVRELMSSPPMYVSGSAVLQEALKILTDRRISSLFVTPPGKNPGEGPFAQSESGIITERDILRAICRDGTGVLEKPAGNIASRPLACVLADAFVYRAIGRMDRLSVRHLGVVDETGTVVGALTARDLLRLRARDAVTLGDEIEEARDVHELGQAWSTLPSVARGLMDEGIEARDIAAIISRELGALTRRAGQIAEMRMREAGRGDPPVPYALLVLGSAGRGESLLAMDQDNAIVFAQGEPDGPEDKWFAELGTHVADILHDVGVPYCTGGVMAKNAQWRGSVETWRKRVQDWIVRSDPEDLLAVDIFFDFRAVHGSGALAVELWRDAYRFAEGQTGFAKLLAEAGGNFSPPLGWFGFRTENGRMDLKKGGLFVIVSTARVLAIFYGIPEHSTKARIESVRAKVASSTGGLDAMIEAQRVILAAILDQQLADMAAGRPPSNKVDPKRLSAPMQAKLKEVLGSIGNTGEMLRDYLTAGPI
ncbi:MAG: CBS domain-containing protein [Xanthobacteraceae bacterium]|nr:CBS domain-containing protein [Xanthobacteraceae bacterium]QYK45373.1 MAG: CBS domain-containing protein [Xanthobacteraceae bacterium]